MSAVTGMIVLTRPDKRTFLARAAAIDVIEPATNLNGAPLSVSRILVGGFERFVMESVDEIMNKTLSVGL